MERLGAASDRWQNPEGDLNGRDSQLSIQSPTPRTD
jgi:hypothetical protein